MTITVTRKSSFSSIYLLCFLGLTHGMMISAMCSTFFTAAVLSNGVLLIMFILSGALWPVESLPWLLKRVSYVCPTTLPTEALRSVLSRGIGPTNRFVWIGFLVSSIWSIIFGSLAVFMFRRVGRSVKS